MRGSLFYRIKINKFIYIFLRKVFSGDEINLEIIIRIKFKVIIINQNNCILKTKLQLGDIIFV